MVVLLTNCLQCRQACGLCEHMLVCVRVCLCGPSILCGNLGCVDILAIGRQEVKRGDCIIIILGCLSSDEPGAFVKVKVKVEKFTIAEHSIEGHGELLEPIPVDFGWKADYNLNWSPVSRWEHRETNDPSCSHPHSY